MYLTQGQPVDWTGGAGVLPAGGVIIIPANLNRRWLYVQNLDTMTVTVGIAGVSSADDATVATPAIPLAPAASAGAAGGILDRHLQNFVPTGAITITGTAGKQVVIMEGA